MYLATKLTLDPRAFLPAPLALACTTFCRHPLKFVLDSIISHIEVHGEAMKRCDAQRVAVSTDNHKLGFVYNDGM